VCIQVTELFPNSRGQRCVPQPGRPYSVVSSEKRYAPKRSPLLLDLWRAGVPDTQWPPLTHLSSCPKQVTSASVRR
jgi:hypothetical protein